MWLVLTPPPHGYGPFARATSPSTASSSSSRSWPGQCVRTDCWRAARAPDEGSHLNQELRDSLRALMATQAELVRRERMVTLVGELSATVAHEVRNPRAPPPTLWRPCGTQASDGARGHPLNIPDDEMQRLDHLLDFANPMEPRPQLQLLPPVVDGAPERVTALRPRAHPPGPHRGREPAARRRGPAPAPRGPHPPLHPRRADPAVRWHPHNKARARPARRRPACPADHLRHRARHSPEVRDRIFEPFVTTCASSTGLGLAIIRRIADRHPARCPSTAAPRPGRHLHRLTVPHAGQISAPG